MKSDACEPGFQHMINMNIINAAEKQKGEDDSRNESEENRETECISHSMVLQYDTLLNCTDQTEFEFSEITAAKKTHIDVRRCLNSSQKQAGITNYFFKLTSAV